VANEKAALFPYLQGGQSPGIKVEAYVRADVLDAGINSGRIGFLLESGMDSVVFAFVFFLKEVVL